MAPDIARRAVIAEAFSDLTLAQTDPAFAESEVLLGRSADRQRPRTGQLDRPSRVRGLVALLTLAVAGCGDVPTAGDEPAGGAGVTTVPEQADTGWFVDVADEVGLRFTHFNGMSGGYFFPEMIPAGVALLDFDNDGDLDAYLVQGQMLGAGVTVDHASLPPPPGSLTGRLFRNDTVATADGAPPLAFTDVTRESGIDADGYGMGVATGDVDNDGWVDLYLTNFGENRLFRNQGDGTFEDIATESGVADPGWGVSAAFLDYDADGWLDLYVGNYVQYDTAADRPCTTLTGRREYCTPEVYPPQADRLYRNVGGGRFEDVTRRALGGGGFGPALGVAVADFDRDGWSDIYVANDAADNLLWMNRGDGTFEDRALLAGAAVSGDGRPEASMGVDAGDFDDDGDDDLFVTHLPTEGNNLYVNLGEARFDDRSAASGLGPGSLGHSGFGAAWLDYDNDGRLDVAAFNGAIEAASDRPGDPFPYDEPNLLFRNVGAGRFENVTDSAGAAFQLPEVSRGAAFGDVDNDGDIDVLVSNIHAPARLLVNQIGTRNHWLGISLHRADGRSALGATVEVQASDGATRHRRARADGSYASANDPRVLVGLADAAGPASVRVVWPGGSREAWLDLPVDRWTTLREGEGAAW